MTELIERIGASYFLQVAIEGWNDLVLLILILIMTIGARRDKSDELLKRVKIPLTNELILFFAATFVYNLCNIVDICFGGMPTAFSHYCISIGVFFYYASGEFQTLLFLYVIKKYVADKLDSLWIKRSVFAFGALQIPNILLLLVTPFTGFLYYIDANNDYVRRWGYWVWQVITILTFVFVAVVIIAKWKSISDILKRIAVPAVVFPMAALVTSPFLPGISLNNIMVAVTALIMFVIYEKNKTEITIRYGYELEKTKTELAESRLELEEVKNQTLLAQIHPHFINNSLMALRSRCIDYPEIYESLTNFSRYLRSNFEALGDKRLILFEQEMCNIEAYLALEQQNFGDRLNIEYDIDCDDFLIPALSVQPLVENAVRHGVATYDKGGTVQINAHRADGKIIIEVIDDGSGRSNITQQQEKRKGIGIESVRARLHSISKGELEIISGEHGTTARITIADVGSMGGTQ